MKLIGCLKWALNIKYAYKVLHEINTLDKTKIFDLQIRSIAHSIRPDRQTLLFSATFKHRIEKLARDILSDPVKVVQGDVGEANTDVQQVCINLILYQ